MQHWRAADEKSSGVFDLYADGSDIELPGGSVSSRYLVKDEARNGERLRPVEVTAVGRQHTLSRVRRPSVLIAEDHDDTREALKLLLELQGYEVRAATDGMEALALVSESLPDVVITDYDMPRLDGAGLARELRAMSDHIGHLPILVLTALGQGLVKAAMEAGADAYIAKPVDFHTLETTLETFIER